MKVLIFNKYSIFSWGVGANKVQRSMWIFDDIFPKFYKLID